MLAFDPKERATARACADHPWVFVDAAAAVAVGVGVAAGAAGAAAARVRAGGMACEWRHADVIVIIIIVSSSLIDSVEMGGNATVHLYLAWLGLPPPIVLVMTLSTDGWYLS